MDPAAEWDDARDPFNAVTSSRPGMNVYEKLWLLFLFRVTCLCVCSSSVLLVSGLGAYLIGLASTHVSKMVRLNAGCKILDPFSDSLTTSSSSSSSAAAATAVAAAAAALCVGASEAQSPTPLINMHGACGARRQQDADSAEERNRGCRT